MLRSVVGFGSGNRVIPLIFRRVVVLRHYLAVDNTVVYRLLALIATASLNKKGRVIIHVYCTSGKKFVFTFFKISSDTNSSNTIAMSGY